MIGKTGAGKSSVMRGFVEKLLDDGKPVCVLGWPVSEAEVVRFQ